MSSSETLGRRLHRPLKLYPKTLRKDHEQEMHLVLMEEAAADQRRPSFADAVNVAAQGLLMRGHRQKRYSAWEHWHSQFGGHHPDHLWRLARAPHRDPLQLRLPVGVVLLLPPALLFRLAAHLNGAVRD